MKKLLGLFCALLAGSLLAAEFTASNGAIDFRYSEGALKVYPAGGQEALLSISPTFQEAVVPALIQRTEFRHDVFSLRGARSSIAFKFEGKQAAFTMSLNRGASPVRVAWEPEVLVLSDPFAEDVLVKPGDAMRALPPYLPMFSGLIRGGNAMVSVIPIKAERDVEISGDLKSMVFQQRNSEDYLFVLTMEKDCWGKARMPAEEGKEATSAWKKPFDAVWQAALPVEKDFLATGDGTYRNWNIISVARNGEKYQVVCGQPRVSMSRLPDLSSWSSGYYGSFHFPVHFNEDGSVGIFYAKYRAPLSYSATEPAYFYALKRTNGTRGDLALPWSFLPRWISAKELVYTTNFGTGLPTCGSTEKVEKIFYKEEDAENKAEVKRILDSMQFFVESIRGRIESGRLWKDDTLAWAEREVKRNAALAGEIKLLQEILADVENEYQKVAEKIQQPDFVIKLSQEFIDLAGAEMDAEKKEETSKRIGRDIRTVGGSQDNLIAHYRYIGKILRYRGIQRHMAASSPEAREFWTEAYRRTDALLQGYYGHEGK